MPIEFPTIEIKSTTNEILLKKMYDSLNNYDWIIFTSVNGVEVFFENILKYQTDIRHISRAKICAIGNATASSLEKHYLKPDIIPDEYVSESLISELKDKIKPADKILIPRAEEAREILPEELMKLGTLVDVVPLYETILPDYDSENLRNALQEADSICFTSASTINNFLKILEKEGLKFPENIKVYCIGSVTANTAKENNIKIYKIAEEYTINGLLKALTEE
jgi:uroporphyrinogen III methyltransferase/synthase